MSKKSIYSKKNLGSLAKIINNNKHVDFKTIDLQDENILNLLNMEKSTKITGELFKLLRAYQRILRIMPNEHNDWIMNLLYADISSATQIASMPRTEFIRICNEECGLSEELAKSIYKNAQAKKSELIVQYMKILQNNEPHIREAKFK